jgi:predicted Zn-dependent protease
MRQFLGVIMSLWGCWAGTASLAQGRPCLDDALRHRQLSAQDAAQLRELQARHGLHAPSARMQEVFDRLVRAQDRHGDAGIHWQLAGYGSNAINAHAMHRGTVVISRGLDAPGLAEQLVAAALAHEMAHVVLRHGLQQACIALQAAQARAMPQVWPWDEDPGHRVRTLMQTHELQADALAVQGLRRAGYPPHSMSNLLRILAARPSPGARARARAPAGSHPDHRLRIAQALRAESTPLAPHAAACADSSDDWPRLRPARTRPSGDAGFRRSSLCVN